MIQSLKALFQIPQQETEASVERSIRLAAAVLLVETARADFSEDTAELHKLEQLLASTLQLEKNEVRALVIEAQTRVEESTSLYDFTRVINEHWDASHKRQLISGMWAVAYADGNIDKYEEHLIRQVADLIYVPHSDYIHCKLEAQR